MDGLLAGKTVAGTGAGRGVGRKIALPCAAKGAASIVRDAARHFGRIDEVVNNAGILRGCDPI